MRISRKRAPLPEAYWFQEGPGIRNTQFRTTGIKLLNVANITKDGVVDLDRTSRYIAESEAKTKYRHFLVDNGDMVIASSGIPIDEDGLLRTRGAFVEAKHLPLCMNTSTIRFKAKPGISDLKYLRHWMGSIDFRSQMTRLVTGIAQKNFGPSHLSKIQIPLPLLNEQKRIAAILDAADVLRAKRRVAQTKLEALNQSLFIEMFGDPQTNSRRFPAVNLASLVRSDDSINYGVVQPGDDLEDGVPLVRVADVTEGHIDHSSLKKISPVIEASYKRSRLRGDEILVTCVGSIGMIGLADESAKGFNIARAVARIRLSDKVSRVYVAEYLRSDFVQRYFTKELRTVSQPTLNIKQLSETVVMVPPFEFQREFEKRVVAFDKITMSYSHSLSKINSLFYSLQHRAFQGEL